MLAPDLIMPVPSRPRVPRSSKKVRAASRTAVGITRASDGTGSVAAVPAESWVLHMNACLSEQRLEQGVEPHAVAVGVPPFGEVTLVGVVAAGAAHANERHPEAGVDAESET